MGRSGQIRSAIFIVASGRDPGSGLTGIEALAYEDGDGWLRLGDSGELLWATMTSIFKLIAQGTYATSGTYG